MGLAGPKATSSTCLLGKLQELACLLPWGHLCTSTLAFYSFSTWDPTWALEMLGQEGSSSGVAGKRHYLHLHFTLEAG